MRIIYAWMKQGLRRIEFFGPEDTTKKKPMPIMGRFAKVHDKYLTKNKGKKL